MTQRITILSRTFLLLATVAFCACGQHHSRPNAGTASPNMMSYSQLLTLQPLDAQRTLCCITDPWHPDQLLAQYLLVEAADSTLTDRANSAWADEGDIPAGVTVIRTPLTRMAVTTACHAWLLCQLGAMQNVAGLCDTAYILSPQVREWMCHTPQGWTDLGSSMSPNAEAIMAAHCDALWISPYENAATSAATQLPLPIIYCADYLESSPLGRAEWMRFYGRLVGKAAQADTLFARVARRYEALAQPQAHAGVLLAELPYGATWYVPGGQSTMARLYADAGYDYPWSHDTHAGSLSLSREAVLAQAAQCDVWLIKYHSPQSFHSLADLLQQDPMYAAFHAAQLGQVWACNTAHSDFFDVTPFRPDSLLQSLIAHDGAFFTQLPTP